MKVIIVLFALIYGAYCGYCSNYNAGQCKMTHTSALAALNAAGIPVISSGSCSNRNVRSCTSLDYINCASIDQVIGLKSYSGCAITVHGGTEVGHAYGDFSHENGYKLDLVKTSCLDTYVKTHMTHIGGNVYRSGAGNFYYDEDASHYDVTYCVGGNMVSESRESEVRSANVPGYLGEIPCQYKGVSGTCQTVGMCPYAAASTAMNATGCEGIANAVCCVPYPCHYNGTAGICSNGCPLGVDVAWDKGAEGCFDFDSDTRCCIGCCEPTDSLAIHETYEFSQQKFELCCKNIQAGAPYTCDALTSTCACDGFYGTEGDVPVNSTRLAGREDVNPYMVSLDAFCEDCAKGDTGSAASLLINTSMTVLMLIAFLV